MFLSKLHLVHLPVNSIPVVPKLCVVAPYLQAYSEVPQNPPLLPFPFSSPHSKYHRRLNSSFSGVCAWQREGTLAQSHQRTGLLVLFPRESSLSTPPPHLLLHCTESCLSPKHQATSIFHYVTCI